MVCSIGLSRVLIINNKRKEGKKLISLFEWDGNWFLIASTSMPNGFYWDEFY